MSFNLIQFLKPTEVIYAPIKEQANNVVEKNKIEHNAIIAVGINKNLSLLNLSSFGFKNLTDMAINVITKIEPNMY